MLQPKRSAAESTASPNRQARETSNPIHHGSPASGEPSSCSGRGGDGTSQPRNPDMAALDGEIARLADRSTPQLRLAWRKLHHTGPPLGLSRDLMIRDVVNKLQERVDGGARLTLRRRLQTLAGEWKKDAPYFDPGVVLKSGTTLLRQWRGRTHTVLVREDGFEYEGQRYRSLTVTAERITGAHWSGPRFFGLTKRAPASPLTEGGQ